MMIFEAPRFMCRIAVPRALLQAAAMLLTLAASVAAQVVDPTESYSTIETQHFRITYTPPLEPLASEAARIAETAWTTIGTRVRPAPGGVIDLLLSDASDITNGFAMAVPSNRITVFVNPPVEELGLQKFNDWLELVITHELTHIFHTETTGTFGRFVRGIFGRVPVGWPVFPASSMPNWATEGLAVEIESLSGTGRLNGSFHDMVVRTAVLENALDPIDRVSHVSNRWPGGQRDYIYGSLFLDYISRTYGPDARSKIVDKTGGTVLPPEFALNHIGKQATGKSFTTLWREWNEELVRTLTPRFDSLRAIGTTRTEPIAGSGRYARHPRVSPDGRFLAFAEETGRDVAHTRVIDLATGQTAWDRRRTGIAASSWLPDSHALLTSQVEFNGNYRLYEDVYKQADDEEQRLTRGARVQDPDVNRDGTRIVGVQNDAGATRLVLLSASGDSLRPVTGYYPNVHWSQPRWSPDGKRIAAARWENGNYDIAVIDTLGQLHLRISEDAAIDAGPAWSPDGRYLLFWSDRTGIPNIFAVDLAGSDVATQSDNTAPAQSTNSTAPPAILQVTNVLTGAYDPEVSPDGKHLYMSVYHADGFYIERAPYDPDGWRPVAPARAASIKAALPAVPVSEPRDYNALRTLRPYYWLPLVYDVNFAGTFVGASTSGRDLLGRHTFAAELAVDPSSSRTAGAFAYAFSGIGSTTIGVSLVRDWDYIGRFRAIRQNDTSIVNGIEREDIARATITSTQRRVRSIKSATIGVEFINRHRLTVDSTHLHFADPRDKLFGPIARLAFSNARTPAYAISPENGVTLQGTGRLRYDLDADSNLGYAELTTWNTAYQAIRVPSFAHGVLALRFSGLWRDGENAVPTGIGGVPGTPQQLGFASAGNDTELLPVRGFADGDRFGTRAWTGSLELRIPIAFPARGIATWPVFLDKVAATLFADAGDAYCAGTAAQRFACPASLEPLVAGGAELTADIAIGFVPPIRTRAGIAMPLSGPRTRPRAYVAFGPAF